MNSYTVARVLFVLPFWLADVSNAVAGNKLLLFLVLEKKLNCKKKRKMKNEDNEKIQLMFVFLIATESAFFLPCIAHKAWLRLPGRLLGGVWIWSGSVRGRSSPGRTRSP